MDGGFRDRGRFGQHDAANEHTERDADLSGDTDGNAEPDTDALGAAERGG
jgi:hypothetical protein